MQDWAQVSLGSLGRIVGGGTPNMSNVAYWQGGSIPWISPKDMKVGEIWSASDYITELAVKESSTIVVPANSILLVTRSGILRTKVPVALARIKVAINQDLKAFLPSDKVDATFLANNLSWNEKAILKNCSKVGTTVESLDLEAIKSFQILLPPLAEQKKIAAILATWDTALATTEKLIAAKQTRKRGLMQRLLTGQQRFPQFAGQAWQEVRLGELFSEIRATNDGANSHSIMTISARLGLISQEDKFARVIAGDSLKKYTQLRRGDFAYNKGHSKTYQMGCIYQLAEQESALVPFVYICFRPSSAVCPAFYKHWFLAHGLDRQLKKIITSGARGDGLLNVNSDDFFQLKVPFPPKDEQVAIAQVFDTTNRELDLLQKQLSALKEQKRGLMQQLLTGQVRVKVEKGEN